MKKETRQARIEQIINQEAITTQEELMEKLKQNGIDVAQATLSRDIREMKIVKQPDSFGNSRYMIFKTGNQNEVERLERMINSTVTDVTQVQFVNVIHTLPSYANVLAAIIDDLKLEMVTGTIAGHDTIVTFSASEALAQELKEFFDKFANPELASQIHDTSE